MIRRAVWAEREIKYVILTEYELGNKRDNVQAGWQHEPEPRPRLELLVENITPRRIPTRDTGIGERSHMKHRQAITFSIGILHRSGRQSVGDFSQDLMPSACSLLAVSSCVQNAWSSPDKSAYRKLAFRPLPTVKMRNSVAFRRFSSPSRNQEPNCVQTEKKESGCCHVGFQLSLLIRCALKSQDFVVIGTWILG